MGIKVSSDPQHGQSEWFFVPGTQALAATNLVLSQLFRNLEAGCSNPRPALQPQELTGTQALHRLGAGQRLSLDLLCTCTLRLQTHADSIAPQLRL